MNLNPRAFDVQLLMVFDSLMTERHVSNAARSIGLSQSAVSHALGRLRERFDDPLLVRTARGMEPTARALALIGPVREALRQVHAVFVSKPRFVPLESKESFVIRIGDANEFLLLPSILAKLETQAPGVSIIVRHLSAADTLRGLEDGSVDLAVSAFLAHSKSIRRVDLLEDRIVCATSRTHPSLRKRLTIENFLKLRHIRVVQHVGDIRFVDADLRARGLRRTVVATIPHWLIALHAVVRSSMAIAVSERMARRFDSDRKLTLRTLPIGGEPFQWQMYWHGRHDTAPAQQWLRTLVTDVCANLDRS